MTSLIVFAVEVITLTNLYVLTYNKVLNYLNANFPPPALTIKFIRTDYSPEPFEILLYLVLTFLFVMLALFYYKYLKIWLNNRLKNNFNIQFLFYCKVLLLIIMAIWLGKNLGIYPLAHDAYPYTNRVNPFVYDIFQITFLSLILFIIIEAAIFEKLLANSGRIKIIFWVLITIIIGLISFEPGFPIGGHDYSYFLGPIWEVSHGKTIYTDVSSQYGFLTILVLALLNKFPIVNVWHLPVLVWILYIVQYSILVSIFWKLTKSLVFSLIGLFSILIVNYLSLFHLPGTVIQIGPMRWLPLIIGLFAVFKEKSIGSKKLIFILSILIFFVIDAGISLVLAYILTLLLLLLSKKITFAKALESAIYLFIYLFLIFLGINLIHVMLGFKTINLLSIFRILNQYAKAGFGMIPITDKTYIWLVPLAYFASIIYFFKTLKLEDGSWKLDDEVRNLKKANNLSHFQTQNLASHLQHPTSILLFSANLMLFASVYFVGRSHPHNLFHIALLLLTNTFILIGFVLRHNPNWNKLFLYSVLIIVFIVYPVMQRREVMLHMFLEKVNRMYTGKLFEPEAISILNKMYKNDIKLINNYIADKKILILSDDDTYLFHLLDKQNFLYDNSQVTVLSQDDVDRTLRDVYNACPKRIVADCKLFNCASGGNFNQTYFSVQPILLNAIQTKCQFTYQPIKCSDHLCIAEAE